MTHHGSVADTRVVGDLDPEIHEMLEDFAQTCKPVDSHPLLVMRDNATGALFVEVHVLGSLLVPAATTDVPLDPDDQADYRANRDVVEDHAAFARMKDDAKAARSFSNIVCEFTRSFDESHPVKIIGGQHRFTAIQDALATGVDEHHGVKLYFGLDNEQRLDVQLISNTNIAVSTDLFDRMTETLAGPQLRDWCQTVGLLEGGEDFADRRTRGNPITVRAARTFIVNYFRGAGVDGDTIRARKMRQDFIEFTPSHLPFLITNHLPKVPADDPALWARLLVIPFDQSFLGREDHGLEDRLGAELPAVLAWAVAGWDDYRGRGRLDPPAAVSDATSTYRISNDSIAGFIDDRCLLNPRMHVVSSDLWSEWEAWCHANSQPAGTNRMLKTAMESRGVSVSRSNGRTRFQGIGLASVED